MRKLILSGLVLGLGGLAAPAVQAQSAPPVMAAPRGPAPMQGMRPPMQQHGAWGQRVNGRWSAGWNAPGGWNGYRRPVAGFALPSYWINPSFYIADYGNYGLPAPAYGYGWSRYYDDAVMTDRYGRVVDVRYGYDWDRYGGYDDGYGYAQPAYRDNRTGSTVAGAVAGGVIGGVAGNLIAGRGNRTAGTILGAGVGAIAGAAIGNASARPKRLKAHRYEQSLPYGYGDAGPQGYYDGRYADTGVSAGGPAAYDGRWVGTWYGRDGASYSGIYDGQYQGYAEGAYAAPAPVPMAYPAPAYGYGYGYSSYGAGTYGETVETVAPTIVTTTTVTEETSYAAARTYRRAAVRKARPRVRVTCSCSCRC